MTLFIFYRFKGGKAYFESGNNYVETEAKAHISTGFPGEFVLRYSLAGRLKFSPCSTYLSFIRMILLGSSLIHQDYTDRILFSILRSNRRQKSWIFNTGRKYDGKYETIVWRISPRKVRRTFFQFVLTRPGSSVEL